MGMLKLVLLEIIIKKKILVCLYFGKTFARGGINKVKKHLAGLKGDVDSCRRVPPDVRFKMKENLEIFAAKMQETKDIFDECNPHNFYYQEQEEQMYRDLGDDDVQEIIPLSSKEKGVVIGKNERKGMRTADLKEQKGIGSYFMPRTGLGNQPTIKSVLQSKEAIEKCDFTILKWMIDSCIPFNAVNFVYYQQSIDVIASMGPSYKGPNFHSLRGSEYVVHMVTNNVANYVVAGRLLEQEFQTLFWSPCAAHCINIMFHDIGKLNEVSNVVSQASKITKYIYNHYYALHLMRKFAKRKEILRPATTHFATNFITLQSILAQKDPLRAMVTTREWTYQHMQRKVKEKRFVDEVLDSVFWKECTTMVQLTEPLIRVLRIVDSDERPLMG
ncbi:uncharacterized protein LOC111376306 [Olea europaea var. sylvestris]|uniref:uncharacterized protein LOC111376306 n=1 Tax=Olea europaea var. sylvestris TaxID=158386 RepID=UPI000C1D1A83|nr:uncharacterized protein LOC111376306 [Olea europaea var. sylvestris]